MVYFTTSELAKRWDVSSRAIAYYCAAGRIPGVVKKGMAWLIPVDAQRPIDRRRAVCSVFGVDDNIDDRGILSVNNRVENEGADRVYYPNEVYRHFGLTRDALLYYEKIGLIAPKRGAVNLYRVFDSGDMFQLMTIDFYRKRGFSLLEIRDLIKFSNHVDSLAILGKKLVDLEGDIFNLQCMLGRLRETRELYGCACACDGDGRFEIRDFPLFSVLRSFDDMYDVANYDGAVFSALGGEDVLSHTIRAISFDGSGYVGSRFCVVKRVMGGCDVGQELVLESGRSICVLTIRSPGDVSYEEDMFFAVFRWAKEQGLVLKGIAYSFIRLLEENNRRVLYEIWIPIG